MKFEEARGFAESMGMGWMSPGYLFHGARALPGYLDQSFKLGSSLWGPVLLGFGLWAGALCARKLLTKRPFQPSPLSDTQAWKLLGLLLCLGLLNSYVTVLALPAFLAYGQWYTVPEYVGQAALFGLLTAFATRSIQGSPINAAGLGATLVLATVAWSNVRERGVDLHFLDPAPPSGQLHSNEVLLEVGRWAGRHMDERDRVGIWDPGIVTYFSGLDFISLDPLMNSPEYINELRHDQLAYIESEGISYIFGPGALRDGQYVFDRMPPGSYEVLWVPFPESDLSWNPAEPWFYILIRPLDATGPITLSAEDREFGLWAPNAR